MWVFYNFFFFDFILVFIIFFIVFECKLCVEVLESCVGDLVIMY